MLLPKSLPAVRCNFVRAFSSTARVAQAVPTEKPVLMKEFKIYRWVRFEPLSL